MLQFFFLSSFGSVFEEVLFVSVYRDQTWFFMINIRQVPWEVLKTEAEGRSFQHLPRDLANVYALKIHFRSLLLHKN